VSQTYNYSIANDTANGEVNSTVLQSQINDSSISTGVLIDIGTTGDDLGITFDVALSAGDKTTLDGVVAAHTGVSLTGNTQQGTSEGASTTTQTTYQNKLGPTSQPLVGGVYQLIWYCELRVTGGLGDRCQVRVRFNGSNVGEGNNEQPNWNPASGSGALTFADGDTPAFDIMFRRQGVAGDTAEVRRARLYLIPLNE
jgi:hypothetical protein